MTVPYIEADDYSYINTKIIPTMDQDFYVLAELPKNWQQNNRMVSLFWVRTANTYLTYGCIFNPNYPDYIRAYRNSFGNWELKTHTKINTLTGNKIEYRTDGKYFYLNGDKYEFPTSLPTESVPYPIYLFKLNEADADIYTNDSIQPGLKLYRWRVIQNGTILQDLVPVYDITDNEYGMYDTVKNQFFGNANKNGNFSGTTENRYYCPVATDNIAPHAPAGSSDITDCGRLLRFGQHKLYLTQQKRTSPSLALKYGDNVFYGCMTTDTRGHLRIKYNNTVYSIYTPNTD